MFHVHQVLSKAFKNNLKSFQEIYNNLTFILSGEITRYTSPETSAQNFLIFYEGKSNVSRTPAMKHIPCKSWQHCCQVSMLPSVGQETCIVKTHRSTQQYPCSFGGQSSVKCIRPAWEMLATKKCREVWFVSWWLRVLRRAITSKRPGILSDGNILLHDNARPRTPNLVKDKLERFDWETLPNSPYIPDLSPCDFHIFGDLKKDICERRFHSDEEVQK